MARVLVEYALGVQPGWMVTISAGVAGLPLVTSVYRHVLEVGARPYVLLDVPGATEMLLRYGSDEQLTQTDPYRLMMVEQSDAILDIYSEDNTRALNNTDPGRQGLLAQANQILRAKSMARIMENRPRTLTIFPTNAYAQDADMSLSDFENLVFAACLLDGEMDAAQRWREVSAMQQRIVDWLAGKRVVHMEAPGTDLTMSIEGRNFVNSDGKRNFPSGEVFTSPVEDTVAGHIAFTYPASYGGRSVQGVRLRFEHGRVVEYSAEQGEDYLAAMLAIDEGARKLGEFAIGTNPGVTQITRNVLLDEKIAGTAHVALGRAYPNAGGKNESAIHWDMVTDMKQGRITVDGELLYENGAFVI